MISFKDILNRYLHALEYANRMEKPDVIELYGLSKDYWEGYKQSALDTYQKMKRYFALNPVYKISKRDRKKLEIDGHELIGKILYRGIILPIFNDIYSSQQYTIFKEQKIPGGAFNVLGIYDITDGIDYILDKEEK